jgi:DNA-binding MarR family transcriptional regulator
MSCYDAFAHAAVMKIKGHPAGRHPKRGTADRPVSPESPPATGRARSGRLDASEYGKLVQFRHALRRFLRFSEKAASAAGLTPQHYHAMLVLQNGGDVTINELAEQLMIKHNSSVGLVDRLVTRQLVRRTRSVTDRRVVHLMLTRRGDQVLAELASVHRHELQRTGPQLGRILSAFARAPVTCVPEPAATPRGR